PPRRARDARSRGRPPTMSPSRRPARGRRPAAAGCRRRCPRPAAAGTAERRRRGARCARRRLRRSARRSVPPRTEYALVPQGPTLTGRPDAPPPSVRDGATAAGPARGALEAMTDSDTAALIRDLSARVAYLEDRQAIVDLMTSYGPAIDSGAEDAAARVWTEDGVYDVDTGAMHGRAEIAAMVRGDSHQRLISNGCAHVLEPGSVVIDGDTAFATCKSLLILLRPRLAACSL